MSLEKRYVLATNVLVSGLLARRSTTARAVDVAMREKYLLMSRDTLDEATSVLGRKKFDRYVSMEDRRVYLANLVTNSRPIQVTETIQVCRDPKDDKFLELAVAGAATCIVTGDEDLLALHPFRDIPILTPTQFLESLAR